MKTPHLFLITLLTIGCTSSSGTSRPSSVGQPDISVTLANPLFFGSGTTAPANFDVTITNRANVPISLRRLEIDSPGMVEYRLVPMARQFNEVIAPGETKTLSVSATVRTAQTRLTPSEPLTVRVVADFEANGQRFREVLLNVRADR